MSMYLNFQKYVNRYFIMIQKYFSSRYGRGISIGCAILVILAGGYFLNEKYVQAREEKAFVALSEAMESFAQSQHVAKSLDATKDEAKIQQAWQDTQILLDALHQEHMSSYLAPYFLVIKSQILLEKDHKLEEAIKVLDEAIAGMSKHSEVTSLFLLKRIKMGFDSVQEEQRKRSLADLIVLTQDTKDPLCEEALYTLGLYYIATGEFEKSQEAFKKLVSGADKDALIPSVWVKQGKEKLVSASDVEIAE